jgi:hypothetical protein
LIAIKIDKLTRLCKVYLKIPNKELLVENFLMDCMQKVMFKLTKRKKKEKKRKIRKSGDKAEMKKRMQTSLYTIYFLSCW